MKNETVPEGLNKLSQVQKMKDIKPLSPVTFPGTHCPLFGSTMTVRLIKEAMMLVIGTEECTYYTKSLSLVYDEFGGISGRCVSFVMNHHDVTFGCRTKLEETIKDLVKEYNPKVIFMVTTCVPEMTGEDIDAIAAMLTETYQIPLPVVHTEHFRCDGHMSGIQNTMTACLQLMKDHLEDRKGVNLLGKKAGNSELVQVLKEADVPVNLVFPSHTTLEEIENATASKLNIVCSKQALAMAKAMEAKYNIPYVSFFDRCLPKEIEEGYRLLFETLQVEMPQTIHRKKLELELLIQECKDTLEGGTYFHGNSGVDTYVLNAFLCSLKMVPLLIQTKEFEEEDRENVAQILSYCDPFMTRSANLSALQDIYGVLTPHLYLGPAQRDILLSHKIIGIGLQRANDLIGFELSKHIVEVFYEGMKKSKELRSL